MPRSPSPSMRVPPRIRFKPILRYATPSPPRPNSPLNIEMPARRVGKEDITKHDPKCKLRCLILNHVQICFQDDGVLLSDGEGIFSGAKNGIKDVYAWPIHGDEKEFLFQRTLSTDLGREFDGGHVEITVCTERTPLMVDGLVEFGVVVKATAFLGTGEMAGEQGQESLEARWWVDGTKFGGEDLLKRIDGMGIADMKYLVAYVAKWRYDAHGNVRDVEDKSLTADCLDAMWLGSEMGIWGWVES
jgi:hypothetical protein